MVVFNKLWQNIHDKIGSYQITISGEITISNKNNTQLLNLFDEERNKIYGYIDYIQKHFPYLSVGYNENLVEISIKIFSYNKYMNRKNFLDELRSVLVKIIYELNDGERFLGRLSITGALVDRFQRSKFIMFSKHSIVEYKVVRQEAISGISSIVFNKIMVCCFTLIALLMIVYTIYIITFSIPDHNPNELLSNILESIRCDRNISSFL